jgi:hypothetical protein
LPPIFILWDWWPIVIFRTIPVFWIDGINS